MYSAIALLLAAGSAVSDRDANDAVMYIQSVSTPALFEVCKVVEPESSGEYDNILSLWSKKHKYTVARGERAVRREAERDGSDVDLMLKLEIESMVSELKELPAQEQRDRCKYIMEVVRSET